VPPLQPGGPGGGRADDDDPAPDDDDLDDVGFRAPLPPEDRIWRHPSELGVHGTASDATPEAGPRPRRALVAGAIAAGALLVGGAAVALEARDADVVERAAPSTSATVAVVDASGPASARPAWLGLHGSDADVEGALVDEVAPDGPAHRAGLRPGDVVAAVDGRRTATMHELVVLLRRHAPGDEVVLAVVRDGATIDVRVRLQPWPEEDG